MQSNIPPPKAGRSYNDKSYVVCSDKRGAIFVIGRRYTPELVFPSMHHVLEEYGRQPSKAWRLTWNVSPIMSSSLSRN